MKVCQIGTGAYPVSPSTATATEVVIYNLSKELSKLCEVHIIDIKDKKAERLPSIKYHEIAMPKSLGPNVYTIPGTFKHIAKKMLFAIKTSLYFISLMKKEKFNIIHTHNQYTGFFLSWLKKLFYKKTKFLYTLHTPFWTLQKNKLPKLFFLKTQLERACLKNSTKIITLSNAQKVAIEKIIGLSPKKIAHISNGVDLVKFHPGSSSIRKKLVKDNEKIVLCVARISKIKNQMVIIKAIPKIIKKIKKTKFVFVGQVDDKKYFDSIQKFIKKRKLETYIIFIDSLENRIMPEYYRAADILVLPSIAEGMPLVLLEAMASGCAIVSSDISPNREVSRGKDIIYFDSKDTNMLTEKISRLLKNTQEKNIFRRNARATAEKYFSWNKIAEKILELYKTL